ncbi:MAG: hypothetical protein ACYDHC_14580 [Desulfuromonadaceae bacterium]
MSYILDALKKIEHENSKKARPDGRVSISGDLFNEQKQPAVRSRVWTLLLLIVAASLVTFAGTWFLLKGNKQEVAAVVPAPAQPVPATAASQLAPQLPVPPLQQPVAADPEQAVTPLAPAAPEKNAVDEDDEPAPQRARMAGKRLKDESIMSPPRQMSPPTAAPVPADIKLSGIAWQDERRFRRAVINGFLLKEGAIVSGARITDIQADRVRFSSPSGLFEIKLDAVLPAEVQQ